MKTKTDKLTKQIQASNRAFKKASKAQKRVMIAQDVIDRIKSGQYMVQSGTWLDLWPDNEYLDRDLQSLLVKDKIDCEVCGIGALFASTVCFKNQVKINSSEFSEEETFGSKQLSSLFSVTQKSMIEFAFECGEGAVSNLELSSSTCDKLYNFIEKNDTKSDKERLLTIMKNIIKNKGTFKP